MIHFATSTKVDLFILGGSAFDREQMEWRDVMGIILAQEDRMDRTYLQHGAEARGVSDLLQRALSQARGE